jgi:hypothetical protein
VNLATVANQWSRKKCECKAIIETPKGRRRVCAVHSEIQALEALEIQRLDAVVDLAVDAL